MARELSPLVQVARNVVVENVRRLLAYREEYAPVDATAFPPQRLRYYQETERELAAEGVTVLGDIEDLAATRLFPATRAFYRFGRAAGGAVTAQWSASPLPDADGNPTREEHHCLVLRTWLEDGRLVMTGQGGKDLGAPHGPWRIIHAVKDGESAREVARRHQRNVASARGVPRRLRGLAEVLAALAADEEAERGFRRSLGMAIYEPILRKLTGDDFEEQGRAILDVIEAHPEWLEGAPAEPDDDLGERDGDEDEHREDEDGDEPFNGTGIAAFLCSEEDGGRRHLTTMGLSLLGLPELQMKAVAANHLRAARFLMNTVARKLIAEGPGDLEAGFALTLTRDDVSPGDPIVVPGWFPEVPEPLGPARVRAMLEPFGARAGGDVDEGEASDEDDIDGPAQLLTLRPLPEHPDSADAWLREVCRRLGQDAPAPLPAEALPAEMQAASERARARLPDFARRFREESARDVLYLVLVGLPPDSGEQEHVWVKVVDWPPDGPLVGELVSAPGDGAGHEARRRLQLREADVFDTAIHTASRQVIEPSRTNLLAQEFGQDL
jgi:hypothetical protein